MNDFQNESRWILCPICGGKTRIKVCVDTVMYRFPLFCPKCKREIRVDISQPKMTVNKWTRRRTQSLLSCEITSQGKQALFIQTHNRSYLHHTADCICPAAEKKKSRCWAVISHAQIDFHGGFDFQSRHFFISGG